jgi:hypothetical protein
MGTKNEPGAFDCYANALPDEPLFTLLARDPDAPGLVHDWAAKRAAAIRAGRKPASDAALVDEARACAVKMERWRIANDGAWRD